MSNTVYKNYSETEKVNFYELHLACLEKEGPQVTRKKYVRKIKSLHHQLDEARMGNDDPSNDEDHPDGYDSCYL